MDLVQYLGFSTFWAGVCCLSSVVLYDLQADKHEGMPGLVMAEVQAAQNVGAVFRGVIEVRRVPVCIAVAKKAGRQEDLNLPLVSNL